MGLEVRGRCPLNSEFNKVAKRSRHFTQHACRALYSEKSRAFGHLLSIVKVESVWPGLHVLFNKIFRGCQRLPCESFSVFDFVFFH